MNLSQIDPFKTSEKIKETYLRYLTTTFGLKNKNLMNQFNKLAEQENNLFKGPILEATPKYKLSHTMRELIIEEPNLLTKTFLNYAPGKDVEKILPLDRKLYVHQEKAIKKIITEKRNVIIATGTGSGKTESFIIPIIDSLLREREKGTLTPGVRALLLYPMNALANDQVSRLRQLLPPETGITFGRYTGQTPHNYKQGLEAFKKENNGKIPQANELFCREQILGKYPQKSELPNKDYQVMVGPPHILLTNFAMLEFLLMRPQDSILFKNNENFWKFLVLDEAHIYTGAKGSEIGFLIRRLKDRIFKSQKGRIQCIATSATIGVENNETKKIIAESFTQLFNEEFSETDVIIGEKYSINETLGDANIWGNGNKKIYDFCEKFLNSEFNSLSELKNYVKEFFDKTSIFSDISKILKKLNDNDNIEILKNKFLYYFLASDLRLRNLLKELENKPIELEKAIEIISLNNEDLNENKEILIKLINLASKAKYTKDSIPLLSVRYHFFVRSLEGLSVCFVKDKKFPDKWPKLLIGKHREVPDAPGGKAVAFELQACAKCGQSFLYGIIENEKFISYKKKKLLEEEQKKGTYLVIDLEQAIAPSEDEEFLEDELPPLFTDKDEKIISSTLHLEEINYLCVRCGYLSENNFDKCKYCGENDKIKVRKLKTSRGVVNYCPACGSKRNYGIPIIRPFIPGDDAVGALLAHSLIQNIPESIENIDEKENSKQIQSEGIFSNLLKKEISKNKQVGKKRLLAFCDSRQDAAYFSAYLNRTSNQILHRQLILKAIKKIIKNNNYLFDPSDLIDPIIEQGEYIGLLSPDMTEITKKNEVSKWLNIELINVRGLYNLENVGILSWRLKCKEKAYNIIKDFETKIFDSYGLTSDDFLKLFEIFLIELRKRNVLQPLNNVRIQDSYFWPRNRPYTIRRDSSDKRLAIVSWIPISNKNIRSDFLERLFLKQNKNYDTNIINKILTDLWELSMFLKDDIWDEVEEVNKLWGRTGQGKGVAWRLKNSAWVGKILTKEDKIYKCNLCGTISPINLHGVCPSYACQGILNEINPFEEFSNNHYRKLYEEEEIVLINSAEHTAQITVQEAAERQLNFISNENSLNVLSCSTTFELGVDVGQLNAVFLRNVPPTVINYIQRAGRAGRRLSSTAFVLTYCRNRSHDLSFFDKPDNLITGKINPPIISVNNYKIGKRHFNAVILSRFWNTFPEYYDGSDGNCRGKAKCFFFAEPDSGAQKVYSWLLKKPDFLLQELKRIFPNDFLNQIMIDEWKWIYDLVKESDIKNLQWDGLLGFAQEELKIEYNEYEKLKRKNPKFYSFSEAQQRRIKDKEILGHLSSRNVLPKYGFPVDVVDLKIESKDEWAQKVELDRDLKLAIGEYAPGCTLVANGKIIKSYALEIVPGKAWPEYKFAICKKCGKFHRTKIAKEKLPAKCDCGQKLDKKGTILTGDFIIPIFGFKTFINEDGEEPVDIRPQKTYITRVYFSHYKENEQSPFINEGNINNFVRIEKRYSRYGVLSVINPGKTNRGFWICTKCGYGDSITGAPPKEHKTPWGEKCKGKLTKLFLGHEFQSDVLEIRFFLEDNPHYNQSFWLSLLAAILAGASKALDIERSEIDGTILQTAGEYYSLVIFDNVPGGAGHVKLIHNNLKKVFKKAYEISDNCPNCSIDQSCNFCLQDYSNQYAHDLLSRGQVAKFLRKVIFSIYAEPSDFQLLGFSDQKRWFIQQLRNSTSIYLVLDNINMVLNLSDVLVDLAKKGCNINLYITFKFDELIKNKIKGNVLLDLLKFLTNYKNINIYNILSELKFPAKALLKIENENIALNWNDNTQPLSEEPELFIGYTENLINDIFKFYISLKDNLSVKKISNDKIKELLKDTKVIKLQKGELKTWKDILNEIFNERIKFVKISDRYIKNKYQFKSLEMFLNDISNFKGGNKIKVTVKTSYNDSYEKSELEAKFEKLKNKYLNKQVILDFEMCEKQSLPHFRKIEIQTNLNNYTLWLDKGLDIFNFNKNDFSIFTTYETYIVIEKNN